MTLYRSLFPISRQSRAFASHSSACSQSTIVHAYTHNDRIQVCNFNQNAAAVPGSWSVRFNSRFYDVRHRHPVCNDGAAALPSRQMTHIPQSLLTPAASPSQRGCAHFHLFTTSQVHPPVFCTNKECWETLVRFIEASQTCVMYECGSWVAAANRLIQNPYYNTIFTRTLSPPFIAFGQVRIRFRKRGASL